MSTPDDIPFDRSPAGPAGAVAVLSPLARRVIAPNRGPFTFTGTCTYIVGHGRVAVIDPGPDDAAHVASLLEALGSEQVEAILVTHTHRDHSPAARLLQNATGAPIIGCATHIPNPDPPSGRLDASHDLDHRPELVMSDGDVFTGDGFTLQAVATPGHASNHLAFALAQENGLFSGDHVMAWSTTIVAPPDGRMSDYMASLEKLRQRDDVVYWPGHGGPLHEPQRFVRGLTVHRRQRETSILARLAGGDTQIAQIVAAIYDSLDPRLQGAAALSVLAHLEDLVERGLVKSDAGAATLTAHYAL
ncbi:MAG: beta-lactamase domain protein [Hyphomicrobiales bacterium]|nr:beta-lactamase domain protein [Hyphomicrobiales bacterium]